MRLDERTINRYVNESLNEFLINEGFGDFLKGVFPFGKRAADVTPTDGGASGNTGRTDDAQEEKKGPGSATRGVWGKMRDAAQMFMNYRAQHGSANAQKFMDLYGRRVNGGVDPRTGKIGRIAELQNLSEWFTHHSKKIRQMIQYERYPSSTEDDDYEIKDGKIRQRRRMSVEDYIRSYCTSFQYNKWVGKASKGPEKYNIKIIDDYIDNEICANAGSPELALENMSVSNFLGSEYGTNFILANKKSEAEKRKKEIEKRQDKAPTWDYNNQPTGPAERGYEYQTRAEEIQQERQRQQQQQYNQQQSAQQGGRYKGKKLRI